MFKDVGAFHAALVDFAPDTLREVLATFLISVSVLVPRAEQSGSSLTFVGGTPIMSAELAWPIPPKPESIEDIAKRGGSSHSKYIRDDLESRLPYSFLGQIDLSETQTPLLPDAGRLLFFYDIAVGPWDNSRRAAKVIWDKSPTEKLVDFSLNKSLVKAEDDWNTKARNYVPEPMVIDDDMKQTFLDMGLTEQAIEEMSKGGGELQEHIDQNIYFGPKRLMQVETHYQIALPGNIEWQEFSQSVLNSYVEDLTLEELKDVYLESELEYKYTASFQVLGLPTPEQNDPRYEAAVQLLFDKPFLKPEEWDEHETTIAQETKNLRLLFQISLADWIQEKREGMVYFIIREEDLKARNFDAVIPVYQQT